MFQIHPLPAGEFTYLSDLSDSELEERNIQVHVSDGKCPCRVSLADAPEGERVFLLNFEHLPGETPFRSRHAIYVRDKVRENLPEPGAVPAVLASRLLSVRAFNARDEMIDADVVDGTQVSGLISRFFENPDVDYIHLHYARQGCFAARVTRPD